MCQHTPGPWVVDEVSEDEAGQETLGICAEEGGYVAGIHCGPDTTIYEQDKANAHIIAAAPAMYEALKAIVGQQRPNRWGYDSAEIALNDEWRAQARAAIAQAEGKG